MEENRWHIYEKYKAKIADIGLTAGQYTVVVGAINDAIFDAEDFYKPCSDREDQN